MTVRATRFPCAAALAILAIACGGEPGAGVPDSGTDGELLVFAAVSLSDALGEAAESHPAPVRFNFAGSNTLAQQILHGPSPDLFLSADRRQMERLVAAGRVAAADVWPLLGNTLVVVVPAEPQDLRHGRDPAAGDGRFTAAADLLRARRIAVADPAGVPAGVYARRWLEAEGLWAELEPRLVPALDVRAALAAVAAGHVEAGIVYATDAAGSRRVRTAFTAPPATAPTITYVAAPPRGGDAGAGRAFLAHLTAPAGRAVLQRHGFTVLPPRS